MSESLVCWHCGAALSGLAARFARTEACAACGRDLHVCRLCAFYDPTVSRHCREPVADPVRDETRANFCGYFTARPGAWQGDAGRETAAARAKLDALFGVADAPPAGGEADPARAALDALFGLDERKPR